MKIVRPCGEEDNSTTIKMQKILVGYAKKHNLDVKTLSIYRESVVMETSDNGEYRMLVADCSVMTNRPVSDYFYMKTKVNGKSKRIPKSEW